MQSQNLFPFRIALLVSNFELLSPESSWSIPSLKQVLSCWSCLVQTKRGFYLAADTEQPEKAGFPLECHAVHCSKKSCLGNFGALWEMLCAHVRCFCVFQIRERFNGRHDTVRMIEGFDLNGMPSTNQTFAALEASVTVSSRSCCRKCKQRAGIKRKYKNEREGNRTAKNTKDDTDGGGRFWEIVRRSRDSLDSCQICSDWNCFPVCLQLLIDFCWNSCERLLSCSCGGEIERSYQ